MTDSDVVIEISRRKLSKDVLYAPDTKIIGVVEVISHRNELLHRSKTRTVANGVAFTAPLLPEFSHISLLLSSVNGPVTTFIGSCQFPKRVCIDSDDPDEEPAEKIYKLFNDNQDAVGKVRCLVYVQARYRRTENFKKSNRKTRKHRTGSATVKEVSQRTEIPQGFRFRKLDRGINWDRIRNLNLERVIANSDTSMLMSCIDDIALGNLEDEDIDPRLYHAMQLAQYSSQYMLGCQSLLNQRKNVIDEAYQCFDKEETELDMQIAKLKARNSALLREEDDLRDLQLQFTNLLEELSPGVTPLIITEGAVDCRHLSEEQKQPESVMPYDTSPRNKPLVLDDDMKGNDILKNGSYADKTAPQSRSFNDEFENYGKIAVKEKKSEQNVITVDSIDLQKPPILTRNVSREFEVGPASKVEKKKWPAEENSVDQKLNFSVNNKPEVINFGLTGDTALDKTAPTNMSVDSLMGSNNYGVGFMKSGGDTHSHVPVGVPAHSSKTDCFVNTGLGSVLERISPEASTTSDMHIEEINDNPEKNNLKNPEVSDVKNVSPETVVNKVVISDDATETSLPLPTRAQSLHNTTAMEKRTSSFQKASSLSRTSSLNSVGSIKRQDISLDDMNDHDDLFEHTGHTEAENSLLSPTEKGTHVSYDNADKDNSDLAGFYDKKEDDIQEFSFVSEVTETSVTNVEHKLPVDNVQSNENTIRDYVEDDMNILDASDMSFQRDRKGDNDIKKVVNPERPSLIPENSNENNEDSQPISEKVVTSPNANAPSQLHLGSGSENSPSITINVHRRGDDEDQDDVLLGTNHFTATYTSQDTESSYNDTSEYRHTAGAPVVAQATDIEAAVDENVKGNDEGNNSSNESNNLKTAVVDTLSTSSENQRANEKENLSSAVENDNSTDSKQPNTNPIHWISGRAPLELVETANALDVFVSAIRFDSTEYASIPKIYIQLEFLEVLSEVSAPVSTSVRMSVLPVSFASYMSFNRETSLILAEEIESQKENLALVVRFIEASDDGSALETRVFADAIVDMWVMIEDSCSIVRQEIDVFDIDGNDCIGSTVVDVRGHHLLSRCS